MSFPIGFFFAFITLVIQDILEFWIPRCGLRNSGTGSLDPFSTKVGFRIPIGSCIPDSKTQDSGLKETIPWFWIPRAKISRIPKSGYTYVMRVLCKRFVVNNPYIPVNWASAVPRVTFDRTKEQEYRPRSSMVTFVTKRAVHPSDWPQELGGDIS